ncbi:MAG: aminotransferase class I/II-fold pyridoxal phosphate-dependent enzyme [Candidatus Eisenbacteria bacterium]
MKEHEKGFSTRCVHSGSHTDAATGAVVTPIYQSSTFAFRTTQEIVDVASGRQKGYVYTRHGNPTVRAVEEKISALEEAEDSLAFSSGMAAISTTLLALVSSGEHLVSMNAIYGGTYELFRDLFPRLGIGVTFVDGTDVSSIDRAFRPETRLLYVESPANPTMRVVDLRKLCALASEKGVRTVVDNTFATPLNQRPLGLGAHMVVHSGTKYLAGHSDVVSGSVSGGAEAIGVVRALRKVLGGVMDPHAAWLLLRGLKTLGVRVERQNKSAAELARFLQGNARVSRVFYPGLEDHPDHAIAKAQMSGFGGMLSFELKSGLEGASRFVESLRIARLAPSLGGVETLVTQPATTSHFWLSPEERATAGVSDALIRVSVGLEESSDLMADFATALATALP